MMRPRRRISWHLVWMLLIWAGLAASPRLNATEKHWIAHEAEVIIVGTFSPEPVFPWFDGWHMNGVITVHETLYGGRMDRQIRLRSVLEWRYIDRRWPPPRYTNVYSQKALWFLRRFDERTWESALPSDPGIRFLSDRSYWEDWIRENRPPQSKRPAVARPGAPGLDR